MMDDPDTWGLIVLVVAMAMLLIYVNVERVLVLLMWVMLPFLLVSAKVASLIRRRWP